MVLCLIRDATDEESGRYTIVLENYPLQPGWVKLDDAIRFCTDVLGASSFSYSGTEIHITRYDNMKRYRLVNKVDLDELILAQRQKKVKWV